MENINELLEKLKNELLEELPKQIVNEIEMNLSFEDQVEDGVISALEGMKDANESKDRLYILSQDKKLLCPLLSAEVHNANGKNPKSNEFPFVITVRSGIYANNVFGWYKDEQSAKIELENIYKALKCDNKVYKMN